MTVNASTARVQYNGNNVTTAFAVPFRFLANSHLQVIRTSSTNVDTTLVLNTDYTVTGAGGVSGTVTATVAPAVGEKLTIIRSMPFDQQLDLVNNDPLPAESLETAVDARAMETQQLREALLRTVQLSASTTATAVLAAPVPDSLIGWNASGTGLENKNPTSFPTLSAGASDAGRVAQVNAAGAFVLGDVQVNVNRITNGDMRVDQRNGGASQALTAGGALAYTVDRWYAFCTGANVTGQQITVGTNQLRYRFTGAASNTGVGFATRIEAVDTYDLAGLPVTIQAKLSSTSLTSVGWALYYASGGQDSFGTLASPTRVLISSGTFTGITSTESMRTATVTFPVGATTGIELVLTGVALLGSQTLTIGEVQMEAGSIPTKFAWVPYDALFARCQRYLPGLRSGATLSYLGSGQAFSGTQALIGVPFGVDARSRPTGISFSNATHFSALQSGGLTVAATAVGYNGASTRVGVIELAGLSGMTAGNATFGFFNNVAGSILFTGCEL